MKKLTITINGKEHEIKKLTGKDWRTLGEFVDSNLVLTDADFIEKHAAFVAKFFEGVTVEDVLEMPLEEIIPTAMAIRKLIGETIAAKMERIEKNSEADKAQ